MKTLLRCLLPVVLAIPLMGAAITFQGPVPTPNPPFALTDGSTVAVVPPYPGQDTTFTLTITGSSHTIQNPTGLNAGQILNFVITENSTGGYTPLWDTNYTFPYTPITYNLSPSAVSVISCVATTTTVLNCLSGTAPPAINNTNITNIISLGNNPNSLYSRNIGFLQVLNNSFRSQLLKSLH